MPPLAVAQDRQRRGHADAVVAESMQELVDAADRRARLTRGYLGIAGQPVVLAEDQRAAPGRDEGLLVVAVTSGSPAAKAGILVGDILIDFDGQPIDSPEDLLDLLPGERVGRAATCRLVRGATMVDLTVTVGERPAH